MNRRYDVTFHGRRYRTTVTFDAVLDVQDAYKDPSLSSLEKAGIALQRFLRAPWRTWTMKIGEKLELLNRIFQTQVETEARSFQPSRERILDFRLDEEYIYASFRQAYGMDLHRESGRLHWKTYLALFQGLPEDTKIREVMRIRAMELPAPDKHNQKQIEQILRLKSYYALPVEGGGGQKGLGDLFDTLKSCAVQKR